MGINGEWAGSPSWQAWEEAKAKADKHDEQVKYKNEAYAERNKLVRLLASLYPSGIKKTAIEGWDEAWHWCVYIDLPTGQASWHFHIDELPMFQGLPPYAGEWDGHTTEEKYEAVLAMAYINTPKAPELFQGVRDDLEKLGIK